MRNISRAIRFLASTASHRIFLLGFPSRDHFGLQLSLLHDEMPLDELPAAEQRVYYIPDERRITSADNYRAFMTITAMRTMNINASRASRLRHFSPLLGRLYLDARPPPQSSMRHGISVAASPAAHTALGYAAADMTLAGQLLMHDMLATSASIEYYFAISRAAQATTRVAGQAALAQLGMMRDGVTKRDGRTAVAAMICDARRRKWGRS